MTNTTSGPRPRGTPVLRYLVSCAVAGLFMWLILRQVDLDEVLASMRDLRYTWLILGTLASAGGHYLRAMRWVVLLQAVKRPVSTAAAFAAVMYGYVVNNILPRGGEVVRVVNYSREEAMPLSAVLATLVVERALDLVTLGLILGASLVLDPGSIDEAFPQLRWIGTATLIGSLVLIGFLVMLSLHTARVLTRVRHWTRRLSPALADRVGRTLETFISGIGAIHDRRAFVRIISLSLSTWGSYVVTVYLYFWAFEFGPDAVLGWKSALAVVGISGLGVIMPVPGSIGPYHYFTSQALHVLYGIPLASALGFATVAHIFLFLLLTTSLGSGLFLLQQLGYLRGIAYRAARTATGEHSGQ